MAVITSMSGTAAADGLGAQRGALLDAEAVLLVDDDHAEAGEVDRVLDQRVGADHDVDRSVGQPDQHVLAVRSGDPVGEQLDPQRPVAEQVAGIRNADAGEQGTDAGGMLLGEHLGRRHQRRLVAALDGDHHRVDGDDGLARADVALQQPVHRMRRRQVVFDLGDRSLLRAGQRVRKGVVEPLDEIA